jgi:hypothetical protein
LNEHYHFRLVGKEKKKNDACNGGGGAVIAVTSRNDRIWRTIMEQRLMILGIMQFQ